jgi:hypothetical protein
MTKSNGPHVPQIKFNAGPKVDADQDLPVFKDTCRERPDSYDPKVVEGNAETPSETSETQKHTQRPLEGEILPNKATPNYANFPDPPDSTDPSSTTTASLEAGPPRKSATIHELPSTIAGPIRAIQYAQIHDRRTLIDQLVRTIPINPYGLPEFFYRPDLLDPKWFDHYPSPTEARDLQQTLGCAILNLNYAEGYPTLPTGLPIWARLEWEDDEGYNIFTEYLEQPGARSIHSLQGVSLDQGIEWFSLNYWSWRTKAFDLYQAAHEQRLRVRRILKTEGSHYDLAEKLLRQVRGRVEAYSPEELEGIDPMTAVNMIEKLVRVQRVSLGLPAAGALDESKSLVRTPMPIDQQMRRLTKDAAFDEQRRQDDTEIDILRDSPEALEMAQDLILKLGRSKGESGS